MMTKAQAKAQGYIVDTHTYPWTAYKGPRFAPTEWCDVLTDLEAEAVTAMQRIRDIRNDPHPDKSAGKCAEMNAVAVKFLNNLPEGNCVKLR